jgi:Cu+-exporting ATPase
MTVTGVMPVTGTTRGELLRYAGAVEHASEHAVAAAVAAAARAEVGPLEQVDGFHALAGLGARGIVAGHQVTVGRQRLFGNAPADLAEWCAEQERGGCTTVLVGWDDVIRGAIAVTDTVKPSAAAAMTLSSVFVVWNSLRLRQFSVADRAERTRRPQDRGHRPGHPCARDPHLEPLWR